MFILGDVRVGLLRRQSIRRVDSSRGFTIIELLIATVVFSVILLILTGAIIQFGRIYYRGNVDSKTKEAARSVMNSIAQDIQFGSGDDVKFTETTPGQLGTSRNCYTYQRGVQVGPGSNQHAIVKNQGVCPAAPTFAAGNEMLGENMQLVDLSVKRIGVNSDMYKVTVHVVYGDDGDFEPDSNKTACKSIIKGGQFCSVAQLETIVSRRL